ncbi:hypothetical protein [Mycolicibacterium conceptionense]|uniref:hypothetical protein n=1 Tax=Mycolicibacterium conceptionense TaxID=451644 RepID=UPI000A75B39D|nr:hypothetical protein [Mycolicibacterium conceptionense]
MSQFAEEALIIAALESDRDEVRRLVRDMLPGERRYLLDAMELIEDEIDSAERDGG